MAPFVDNIQILCLYGIKYNNTTVMINNYLTTLYKHTISTMNKIQKKTVSLSKKYTPLLYKNQY